MRAAPDMRDGQAVGADCDPHVFLRLVASLTRTLLCAAFDEAPLPSIRSCFSFFLFFRRVSVCFFLQRTQDRTLEHRTPPANTAPLPRRPVSIRSHGAAGEGGFFCVW
jgi:hypothetical protein